MAGKRVKPGMVLEVSTPKGLAYVQYVIRHPEYGDMIRVLPGFLETRPTDFREIVEGHRYFTFYPAAAALTRGFVTSVDVVPIPDRYQAPRLMRRTGGLTREGKVLTWFIIDGDKEILRHILRPEEKRLSIAEIWNHEMLVLRLSEGWTPEQEG